MTSQSQPEYFSSINSFNSSALINSILMNFTVIVKGFFYEKHETPKTKKLILPQRHREHRGKNTFVCSKPNPKAPNI